MRLNKEQRKKLNDIKALRKQQIKDIGKLIIPYKEDIQLAELVLKGQLDIRAFINHSKQVSKYTYRL